MHLLHTTHASNCVCVDAGERHFNSAPPPRLLGFLPLSLSAATAALLGLWRINPPLSLLLTSHSVSLTQTHVLLPTGLTRLRPYFSYPSCNYFPRFASQRAVAAGWARSPLRNRCHTRGSAIRSRVITRSLIALDSSGEPRSVCAAVSAFFLPLGIAVNSQINGNDKTFTCKNIIQGRSAGLMLQLSEMICCLTPCRT